MEPARLRLPDRRITRDNLAADDHRFADQIFEFDREKGFALVELLRSIAAAHDATPAQIALAWLLASPAVSSVLLGATRLAQLDDNLAALDVTLTADDIAAIGAAVPPAPAYPDWFEPKFADGPLMKAIGRV